MVNFLVEMIYTASFNLIGEEGASYFLYNGTTLLVSGTMDSTEMIIGCQTEPNTSYNFRVRLQNSVGLSDFSNIVSYNTI
jgi:hypothetical protein